MKTIVFITLMTLTGALAQAAGRNEAAQVCKSMTFESDRNACISAIGKYSYFEQGAIDICVSMSFDSEKSNCVTMIGDKSYEAYEIENCAGMTFDSQKWECLKNNGRRVQTPPPPAPPSTCVSKQQLVSELQRLDYMVYNGDNFRARNVIFDLISALQRCP